jgi:sugar phosphate isomerase/epimerase
MTRHPPMTLDGLCRRARELGVAVIQVCENLTSSDDELRAAVDGGFDVEIGTRGIDSLPEALRRAGICGSAIVRLVVDDRDDHPSPAEVISRLRGPLAMMADAGVRLAVENHDRFPSHILVEIIESLGVAHAGITLDTVNSFGALEGPAVVVKALAPYILSLHVKDFIVRRIPSQMGFVIEGRPAGSGQLDIPWLLAEISGAGRSPNAIIELWTPAAESPECTLDREADWARQSVIFMRKLIHD